jgi:hypothetical protein
LVYTVTASTTYARADKGDGAVGSIDSGVGRVFVGQIGEDLRIPAFHEEQVIINPDIMPSVFDQTSHRGSNQALFASFDPRSLNGAVISDKMFYLFHVFCRFPWDGPQMTHDLRPFGVGL